MSPALAIALSLVLLAGNGFFVLAEFALVSARRASIEIAAADGRAGARTTLRAMERVSLMMAGAQLGITLCSLGLGALGEPAVAHLLEPLLHAAHLPDALLHVVSFAVAMAIVVFLHMVVGEMFPKNLALADPERSALLFGPPMYAIAWVLRPVLWLLNGLANVVLKLLRVEPQDEVSSTFTADEVGDYLEESREEGLLEDHEHRLMAGAVGAHSATAADVLVDMADIVVLGPEPSRADAEAACVEHGFSRFPVVDAAGGWIGYIHVKDVLDVPPLSARAPLPKDMVRPLATVALTDPVRDVLARMQASESHMAMVTDGNRMVGAAMLEDVVELLVGQVSDATPTTNPRSHAAYPPGNNN
ncbi:hemolysin family protein [Mariniluteicoccus endophyticus]